MGCCQREVAGTYRAKPYCPIQTNNDLRSFDVNKAFVILALASTFGVAAQAQEAPASPFTGNINLTSNYKFRGQDQSANKAAVQGGFDYSKDGFYVGNWNSSISLPSTSIEMDLYAGYKGEIAKDTGYDVGILQYHYPQSNRGVNPDFNTTELYGAVSFGPTTVKYSHTVSSDYFGTGTNSVGVRTFSGRNTGYLDVSANYEIVKSLTLNTHVGYTRFSADLRNNVSNSAGKLPNYYDYKLGVTYDLGSGFSVAGAVVGANQQSYFQVANAGSPVNKSRFIATLTKSL